jgi:transcriptional regulator with GAF, ATPase, and Fis domain
MDKYTILDQSQPDRAVAPLDDRTAPAETARRDLDAALQLLAERAQYLTGASGSSIALCEDDEMVCRASTGRMIPEVGAEIETDSGLIAESIRTRQIVHCENADRDSRANRESCEELGVKSVMVMPLLSEQEVVGVFELVADRVSAFEERDVAALTRITEIILTAVEHAEAAQRVLPEIAEAERAEALAEREAAAVESAMPGHLDQEISSHPSELVASVSAEIAQIGSCQSCGFPVSQGRTVCVDCEQAGRSAEGKSPQLNALEQEESWLQAHSYVLGALAVAALTIALLALKLR